MTVATVKRRELKQWRAARTLADLGHLMARWLEGDLESRPGYYGSTDLDTPELTVLCAALCRAGFVTVDSQRAWSGVNRDGEVVRARCTVSGFCDTTTLRRLADATHDSGLILATSQRLPVVTVDGDGYYWAGGGDDLPLAETQLLWGRYRPPITRVRQWLWEPSRIFRRGLVNRRAFQAILGAHYVAVVDPEWGHDGRLVDVLTTRFLHAAVSR